mgnify:FL=1
MIKWIEEMNKMFKANPYTDARVTVDYCENAHVLLVSVYNETSVIEIKDFTEYGLMMECMRVVDKLYKK